MTNKMQRMRVLILPPALLVSFAVQAQDPDMPFEDGCSRQSPEEMRPLVVQKLGELEAELSRGNLDQARKAKMEAEGATRDIAGWPGALGIKCIGDQQLYRRYFVDSQRIWVLHAGQYPEDLVAGVRAALWSSVNNDHDAKTVLEAIPDDYRQYVIARNDIDRAAEGVARHRKTGAFVIAEEIAVEQQARRALALIDDHARQRYDEALARESKAFYRDATEFEKDSARTVANLSQFAGAMAGVDTNPAEQSEYQLVRQRIRESFDELNTARGWALNAGSPAADQRARERGDEVISWADREDLSFTTRDEYYERAQAYYDWCRCAGAAARVAAAREAIQPQLEAEQARRQAQSDEIRKRLDGQAEDLQRAMDDMQKTEAEKKAFDEEADALEAELGF